MSCIENRVYTGYSSVEMPVSALKKVTILRLFFLMVSLIHSQSLCHHPAMTASSTAVCLPGLLEKFICISIFTEAITQNSTKTYWKPGGAKCILVNIKICMTFTCISFFVKTLFLFHLTSIGLHLLMSSAYSTRGNSELCI